MPHQGVLQQLQAWPLGFNELQVRWLGQVREIGMALGPQVQLLRSGHKGKGAFRKETTTALPCSTIANHSRRTGLRFPEGSCGEALWPCTPTSQVSAAPKLSCPGAGPPSKGPRCCPLPQHHCCVTWKALLSPPVPPVQ